jgi:hypothetical protein
MDETCVVIPLSFVDDDLILYGTRMYDRHLKLIPTQTSTGLRYRFETLTGITGYKMAKYRARWSEVLWASLDVAWRPQFFFVVFFEVRCLKFRTVRIT